MKVTVDGIVGPQTVTAINCADQEALFNALKIERKVFLNNIIKRRPDQIVFYDGWMNRVNSFNYKATKQTFKQQTHVISCQRNIEGIRLHPLYKTLSAKHYRASKQECKLRQASMMRYMCFTQSLMENGTITSFRLLPIQEHFG
ncbi:MAG: putative peptidoglycan-binding domain-containing protein [Cyclobacteriaceae bacterium]